MANLNKLVATLRCCILHSSRNASKSETVRHCSKLPRKWDDETRVKEKERESFLSMRQEVSSNLAKKYWNERKALKRAMKQNSFPRNVDNIMDLMNSFVTLRQTFPGTLIGLKYYINRWLERRSLLKQSFLPERLAVLKPDLAAAHFVIGRGGSVRFMGQKQWLGMREKKVNLPNTYVPGLFIEEIQLEGTEMFYEGLDNIMQLENLKSLSLKGLEHANDWWLDKITGEYYWNLKHLDLTDCKKITYRGLSCLYRFEQLETLNVEGVPHTPEFKLACLMLQDVLPELEILGIDLSIPEEIKAVVIEANEKTQNANAV